MTGPSKSTLAYEAIESLIMFQEIAPGSLVSEALLMQMTGLGRSPIREALQQLSRDGMVEIHPNKGVLVPPITIEAQLRLLETRRVLEALAVRLASLRATRDDLRRMGEMSALLAQGGFGLKDYMKTVKGTHALIVESAHNDYLAAAMASLQGLSRRFWISHIVDEQTEIARGAHLHMAILEAILARDANAAEQAALGLNDYLVDFARSTLN